tara:strand:+ start:3684 stop:4121 length:438 start_codon:yes stop_codon:yes gene_type:complete
MFYITDTFNIEDVSIFSIADLRFEEITETQFKKMCDGSPKVVSFKDRKALSTINRLLGEIHQTTEEQCFTRLLPTDVVVLYQREKSSTTADWRKLFKVTCRRDFEVFEIDDAAVILDRDGNIIKRTTANRFEDLLHDCREMNLAN